EKPSTELDDATQVEIGRRYSRRTGERHLFRLPADWMTISFLIDSPSQIEHEYPRFVLESADRSYTKELSAKRHLVSGADYFELRFERLLDGKQYTLTHVLEEQVRHVVFEARPFFEIVDQPRATHERLPNHSYAGLAFDGAAGAVSIEQASF